MGTTGKKIKTIVSAGFLLLVALYGCKKELEDYFYADTEESVDIEMLTLLRQNENYSDFLSILDNNSIDTVFSKGKTLTLFVPTNEVVQSLGEFSIDTTEWIKYLFTESYINIGQIQGAKKIQTLGKKFAVIENSGGEAYFDGAEITQTGPLCRDGKYYEISELAVPLPNLYEFISLTNPFFKSYIDLRDSSYLDLELSKPLGYDQDGNTIYDTVLTTVNLFEEDYFPISEEFRSKKATMLLFTQEQFDDALSLIADDLGLPSIDNIPNQWKNDVLLPYLSDQGVFWNNLEPDDFGQGLIRNIKGDTVFVELSNIDFNSSFECSNGRAYNYINFEVPDSIYSGRRTVQGEHLVISKGNNLFSWKDEVSLTGDAVDPSVIFTPGFADNDSTLLVRFDTPNSTRPFSMTFRIENVFPGTYRLLLRLKTTPSGVYQILVNGEVQDIDLGYGVSDRVDFYDLRKPVRSIAKQGVFRLEDGFNSFDLLVENIMNYGDVEITILYVEPGQRSDNGFVLDYILLETYNQ